MPATCRSFENAQARHVDNALPHRFLERAKVSANVVDIESEAQSILFPASVTDLGGGDYEVRLQHTTGCSTSTVLSTASIRRL